MATFKDELNAKLKTAQAQADLSYAKRLKVGAVLVRDWRTISEGRNGMPSGGTNVCEYFALDKLVTKAGLVHAEANLIAFAAAEGIATKGCILVTTHSPCFECAKLIKQAKIKKVYYQTEYRLTESLDFLKEYHVDVEQIK